MIAAIAFGLAQAVVSGPTLNALKQRGLVELARYSIADACGPSCTALRPIILIGPSGSADKFVSDQYECIVDNRIAEEELTCSVRSNRIHG